MRICARFRDPQTNETLDRAWRSGSPDPIRLDRGRLRRISSSWGPRGASMPFCRCSGDEPGCARRSRANSPAAPLLTARWICRRSEALADLIDARNRISAPPSACEWRAGALRRQVDDWREAGLVEASALLEAEIDFADEGDVGSFSAGRAGSRVASSHGANGRDFTTARRLGRLFATDLSVCDPRASQRRQVDAAQCAGASATSRSSRKCRERRAT